MGDLFMQSHDERIELVSGLDAKTSHQVTAWYVTDPYKLDSSLPNQWVSFLSFDTDGTFGLAPKERQRRLQIIGDSITAGCAFESNCRCDHSGSYEGLLCEHFEANCTTQAISSKGLYQNCCDNDVTMSELSRRIIVGDPSSIADDSEFVPDGVLINLGTNDLGHPGAGGTQWVERFTQMYANFLVTLSKNYNNPSLQIFCGAGPIRTDYGPFVKDAMSRAEAQGLTNLHYIDFGGAQLDGCGHPGPNGHRQMFEAAAPIVSEVLGWPSVVMI